MEGLAYVRAQRLEERISEAINVVMAEQPADAARRVAELLLQPPSAAPPPSSGGAAEVADGVRRRLSMAARGEVGEAPLVESTWTVAPWLASLGLAEKVGERLLAPLHTALDGRKDKEKAELEYVRELGRRGTKAMVLELLGNDLLDTLGGLVWDGAVALLAAGAATGAELHAKFVQEGAAFTMSYGGLDTFWGGLEALIGTPNPKLEQAIEREHRHSADSRDDFLASNYGTTTTSEGEYLFVLDPEGGLAELGWEEWPADTRLRADPARAHLCRVPLPLSSFDGALAQLSAKLAEQDCAPMLRAEAACARLYTGPLFIKYNLVLRGLGSKLPFFARQLEELCRGNVYTTTLHSINSACVKLSKILAAQKVYRGVSGASLPTEFWEKNEWNVAGGVEFAFMSTTRDREVAMSYASSGGGAGLVFCLSMGMTDRGADLSWISQYPHESEILFAPLTGLEVQGTRAEGGVIVVDVRLSVNLNAMTIEQVVSRRRKLCADMCESMQMELMHEVKQEAWATITRTVGGAFDLPRYAADVLADMLREATSYPPEHYNDETNFLTRIKDAVLAKNAVSGWPAGWERLLAAMDKGAKYLVEQAAKDAAAAGAAADKAEAEARARADASAGALRASRLRTQTSGEGALKAAGAGALSVLMRLNPSLEALEVRGEEIGTEGAIYLGHGVANAPALTSLDASMNKLCGIESYDDPPALYRVGNFVTMCDVMKASTSLRSLDVSDNLIGAEGAAALTAALLHRPSLTHLKMGDSALQLAGWEAVAAFVRAHASLTLLEVPSCLDASPPVGPLDAKKAAAAFGEAVAASRSLTRLDVSCNEFKRFAGPALAPLFSCRTLADVDASSCYVGPDAPAKIAPHLRNHPALTILNLSSNKLGAAGAALFAPLRSDSRLTELDVSDNDLDAAAADAMGEALRSNTTLAQLNASSNLLGGKGLAAGLAANRGLTHLDVSDCKLAAEGSELIGALATNTSLRKLIVNDSKLTEDIGEALDAALRANSTLVELNLSYNKLGPDAVPRFAAGLGANTALTDLNLSDCSLGAGAGALADALATNRALTKLDVGTNQLPDAAGERIFDALAHNASLVTLVADSNELGPLTGGAMARMVRSNGTLATLRVDTNQKIGDAPFAELAAGLVDNRALTDLNADECGIKAAACAAFTRAFSIGEPKYNTALRTLSLDDNAFPKPSGAKLREAFLRRACELKKQGATGKWSIKVSGRKETFTGEETPPPEEPKTTGVGAAKATDVDAELDALLAEIALGDKAKAADAASDKSDDDDDNSDAADDDDDDGSAE
ncbi:hypothetical protein AB1Y20_022418 [Prymnesium parvum]|uniref:Mono(ADP-ribosyl)transferase n=1 Tax=Prymnesium parvum TaxID=97485 RepID=A0AB34JHW2_PRYPA